MSKSAAKREGAILALSEGLAELRSRDELGRDEAMIAIRCAAKALYPSNKEWRKVFIKKTYNRTLTRAEELW